jgi:hypothetical protein
MFLKVAGQYNFASMILIIDIQIFTYVYLVIYKYYIVGIGMVL